MGKKVVTVALPYANGDIHIGHLLEHIFGDIYARFLRLTGKEFLFICGSDMHGTPIELNARKKGIEPEQFALDHHKKANEIFKRFLVEYDNYSHTHTEVNKDTTYEIYNTLNEKGLIDVKVVKNLHCETCQRFLPDRHVKGTCPSCGN